MALIPAFAARKPDPKGRFPLGGIFRAERNFSLYCDFSGGTN